ncbi:MAG TPA: hypothetical protein VLM85_33375 [Polyangiaceae bacterium]|nr:hypothetical protein [Polyangiaceae bacterium]
MTSEPRDETLARPFAELRRADAENAPPFDSMWRPSARGTRRVSPWWVTAPAVSVVAAAAALALWVGLHRSAEPAPQSASVAAASPSPAGAQAASLPLDFLLDQPSLATLPDFDSPPRGVGRP